VFCSADGKLVYSLLQLLKESCTDGDIQLMLLLLQSVGHALRAEDPAALKMFIGSVEDLMGTLGRAKKLTQRARLLMELVVDMKDSKKQKRRPAGLEAHFPADVLKQLRGCSIESVAIHSLTWQHVRLCSLCISPCAILHKLCMKFLTEDVAEFDTVLAPVFGTDHA
jgi:hypothetical protein